MKLKLLERCYPEQADKERHNIMILAVLVLSVIGIVGTSLHLNKQAWKVETMGNICALILLIGSALLAVTMLYSLIDTSINTQFCNKNEQKVYFKNSVQKLGYMVVLIILFIVAVVGVSFTVPEMVTVNWSLVDAPFVFIVLIASLCVIFGTVLAMYRASTKIPTLSEE